MKVKQYLAKQVMKLLTVDREGYDNFVSTFGDYFGVRNRSAYNSWVFSCLDIMGKYFAKAQFRLYKNLADGTKKEVVKPHPFTTMLKNPNGFQTMWELMYMYAPCLGLYGNYYLRKLRTPLGIWKATVLVSPANMQVTINREDGLPDYQYFDGKNYHSLARRDVVHIRYPNPDSSFLGKPIMSYFMDQIEVEQYQLKYQKQFYKNGGWLGNVFSTAQELSNASYDRAKKELTENFGNTYDRTFRAALFDQDLKPVKGAFSMKDMDIKSQRELNRTEVLGGFQVPEALLGIAGQGNRATVEAVIYSFTTGVVDPLLSLYDQVLTFAVMSEFGEEFQVIHDSLAPKDVEGRLNYYKTMQENGNMTINEVRAEEGWDKQDYELCDVPLINVGGTIVRLDREIDPQTNSNSGDTAQGGGEIQSGDGKDPKKPKK